MTAGKTACGNAAKEIFMKAEEYSKRGGKYFNERNFDGAIADFTEVIRLEPDNPFAYYKRGMSYTNKKQYDLAMADFTEAIRLEPNKFGNFYMDRAYVYVLKGDKTLAVSDLEMAVKIDPQNETYSNALNDLKSGNNNSISGSTTEEKLRKEIKAILIGAIICAVICAVPICVYAAIDGFFSVVGAIGLVWVGLGLGGTITLVPFIFKLGWNLFGLWNRIFDFVKDIFSVSADTLRFIFFLLRLFLGALCVNAWLFCLFAGPIWPLIRILLKRKKLKKIA